jgi:hypothetical protein
MEAIEEFPQDVDVIKYQGGSASLIKMDIFKRLLYYSVEVERGRNTVMALPLERVKLIKDMNLKGQLPEQLMDPKDIIEEEGKFDFADVTGDIELPDHKKKRNKKRKKPGANREHPQSSGPTQPNQRSEQRRTDNSPKPPRDDQKQKTDQGQQTNPQGPRLQKLGEGPQPNAGGKKRHKNRNRKKGPRPGGERPPQNPPTA